MGVGRGDGGWVGWGRVGSGGVMGDTHGGILRTIRGTDEWLIAAQEL